MAEVVFLGTSCGIPMPDRNHPGIHFQYNEHRFLFDCGENTQRQLAIAKLSPMKISRVFITHFHGDHYFGLIGFIQSNYWRERTEPLYIYGPKGIKTLVEDVMRLVEQGKKTFELVVEEVKEGVVVDEPEFTVSAFPTKHSRPGFGYVFQEKERLHADEKKLRKIGLNPGPLYGDLKAGKTVEWKGKKLKPADYVTREKGIKFVYTGDTEMCDSTIKAAEGADLLVHDSTFAQDASDRARDATHSTARDAGEVARQANVRQLVLTHFSTRYKEEELDKLLQDAKKEFDNVIVAKDFMRLEI
ncbi:MAG: ribonuclease Z [Candidatus Diapherotrites archaeon]|nr:ribonuclease Z [Candidatus Diapherotrites archaeon]